MKKSLLPILLISLAGCQQSPRPATAQTETPPVATQPQTPFPTAIVRDTALDKYLARPENVYGWESANNGEYAPGDGDFNLELTSQTWQGKPWTHRLQIFKPENARFSDAALLNISFGSGTIFETIIAKQLANATGCTVVNVFNVPNQPLFGKSEDDLIAYTFGKTLETGDGTWPLLLPMTKSVTKAMDALQEWSGENTGAKITRFIVSGASKRGWTTYLAAAGDSRVVGAIPIVYNNLDLPAQIAHQKEVWKETSPLASPYADSGLFEQMETDGGKKLIDVIDPWSYRARLTMPKLLVHATNDGYWPLDALELYRAGLPGQTDVFNVPNAPHILGDSLPAVLGDAAAWSQLVLAKKAVPTAQIKVEKSEMGHVFSLSTDGAPRIVRLWFSSSKSRDFRRAAWKSLELEPRDGLYRATVAEAKLFENGDFAQAFGEIAIPAQPLPLRLSSELWEGQNRPLP